jgi:uncharacterized protein
MPKTTRATRKSPPRQVSKPTAARDSFQNFAARLGYGTNNLSSGASYSLDYISHNRQLLENIYTSSWIASKAVDTIAEDCTKKGIEITSLAEAAETEALMSEWDRLQVWSRICDTIRWARLYGGAIAVLLIDGQDLSTPLRIQTIGQDQFKGLLVLDRWMAQPSLSNLVKEYGPDFGKPKYYSTVADSAMVLPGMKIHHSRVIRMEGQPVPYYRRLAEQGWGISVLERMYDRLLAFDSATAGIAQLVYKAHLRTLQVEGYREILATGGPALEGLLKQVEMIRLLQSNEGITLLDSTDTFTPHSYTFSGLDNVLLQFGQQLSGSLDIPLTKLFGQAPAGLNATGESDLENYNSGIHQQQETNLRTPISKLLEISYRSKFGRPPADAFAFKFRPLKQMSDLDKANVANTITTAITAAESQGIIDLPTAAQELRHSSQTTGVFSHITDESIEALKNAEPPEPELDGPHADPAAAEEAQ